MNNYAASIVQARLSEVNARVAGRFQEISSQTGLSFPNLFSQAQSAQAVSDDAALVAAQLNQLVSSSDSGLLSLDMDSIQSVLDKYSTTGTTAAASSTTASGSAALSEETLQIIQNVARQYGVDPLLIQAVAYHESGYNPKAVSSAGAIGFMQLMPDTASGLGIEDPYDLEQNIDGGARVLLSHIIRYDGDMKMALAAYNCGPEQLRRLGITNLDDAGQMSRLPSETQAYLERIMGTLTTWGRQDLYTSNFFV